MSRGVLFLTGATGSVGVEVVRLLLQQRSHETVYLLIRGRTTEHTRERWERLLAIASEGDLHPEDVPNFKPVPGDITALDLGMSASDISNLVDEVTEVLHIAAEVKFDMPLDWCRTINVEGTRYTLGLAERFRHLEKFGHVSSLYVAGRRRGIVLESELEHDAGFVTYGYEQSKYEAELLLREYLDRLPIAVYRLSLLLGRQRDGYVHDFGAIHRFIQFTYQGIAPCLPGGPDNPLDFLPNDYSAECLCQLFFEHFRAGATYQVASSRKSITAERWMELTGEVFSKLSERWRKGVYNPPDVVDWPTYRLYVDTVDTIDNPGLRKVTRVLDSCAEELFCPKVFDRTAVDEALGTTIEDVPDYECFYPRILEHCVKAEWGRYPKFPKV